MSKYCKNCGERNADEANFCENCGSNLSAAASVAVNTEPEIVEAEVVDVVIERPRAYESPAADAREVRERLVGTKQEFYLPHFEKMETLNSFTSWNWAAFIFGTAWMMYRRMYVFGVAMWIVNLIIGAVDAWPLTLVMWFAYGLLGNYLYMKDINNRTDKAMDMQPDERELYIQKNSGVSWVGVIVVFAASMVYNALF